MNLEDASAVFGRYVASPDAVNTTIHPNDHMFNTAAQGMKDYMFVGQSGVRVLLTAAQMCRLTAFGSILDFGCGHGRVGRHLRACWPESKLTFSDLNESCWKFCAETFQGDGFSSSEDFSTLEIPGSYDIIWLGSVLTHTDWPKSSKLMEKLCAALNPNGAIVATFHGRKVYREMKAKPLWAGLGDGGSGLIEHFEADGFGYGEYPFMKNWGVNLIDWKNMQALTPSENFYLAGVIDTAWANLHDIGIWCRRP